MRQLLYVSNTSRDVPERELEAILASSRANNTLLGVSGLLLYIDGGFLQILEGEERVLRDIYIRICADSRHWEQRKLLDHEAPPAFAGWSMGFEHLVAGEPERAGMFGITRDAIAGKLSPGAGRVIVTMLETFYRVQQGTDLKLRA